MVQCNTTYFHLIATMMYSFIITNQLLSINNTLKCIVKNGTLIGTHKTIKDDYYKLHFYVFLMLY